MTTTSDETATVTATTATTATTAATVSAQAADAPSDDAATQVTVRLSPNRGTLASGVSGTVTAAAGSTITLPTADQVTLTGNQASTLIGWSTSSGSYTPDYLPGASYTVPDSNVVLYAVWQKTMTLAPTLNNMQAYYMVVDINGNVLQEGELNGAVTVKTTGPNSKESFVNVFVKPTENHLITRVDSASENNFIYPLSGTNYGRPGNRVSAADIARMKALGYLGTFGWGSAYHKNGDVLHVNASAIKPTPTATITEDKDSNLTVGDQITLTVTLQAGDIDNLYQATLSGNPVVTVSGTDMELTDYTQSGDTYTGQVKYTLTEQDLINDSIDAGVTATFNYKYAYGVTGSDGSTGTLDSSATITSTSDTVTIRGLQEPHSVSYEYTYTGHDSHPDSIGTAPTDSATYSYGSAVTVSSTPAAGDVVDDLGNGGTWTFQGWTLGGNAVDGTVTMRDADLAFVGEWVFAANPDELDYYANGGTGTMSPSEGVVGSLVRVAENGFARDGYRFLGWNTKADGSGNAYVAGVDHYMLTTGTDELFAMWEEAKHVTYEYAYAAPDGVTSHPDAIQTAPTDGNDYYLHDAVSLTSEPSTCVVDDPVNHGTWTFGGWDVSELVPVETTGSSAVATASGTAAASADASDAMSFVMGPRDVTITGTWTFIPYTRLSYDGNGSTSGSVDVSEGAAGSDVTVAENGFTRDGYRFVGWNTEADGSGTAYSAADAFLLGDEDVTLYAQWEKVAAPQTPATQPTSHPTSQPAAPVHAAAAKNALPKTGDASNGLLAPFAAVGAALAAATLRLRRRDEGDRS
ncbi:MAG: InlB B-repeat-containing protein [Atopobiaceae bacterium]|jgi:uncharacterized repeat protein (TIGR02543 family)/LPXTG-motif cell wall-anchored protein|nr:InlB B-repeat-containing protein [Atopobiaceae bacterium]MCI1318823.1 InlB B-repeat-containing protein [Atopobiaceae bacterium]MCI1389409.1 InlB B-repeat-containing protein [Atopobiaceae bacterium]MCI1432310.1 InlB B-repeat-containing protein [Atopobiaceae bacterium]MCI1470768.1 InlB B-repeat-containing protein [Atopobiaceae bacterium]